MAVLPRVETHCAEAGGIAALTTSATTSRRSAWIVRGTAIELQQPQRRTRGFLCDKTLGAPSLQADHEYLQEIPAELRPYEKTERD
jgi:hypothetical protein